MAQKIKSRTILNTGKILIGIMLIALLFLFVSPGEVWALLISADKSRLTLGFLAFCSMALFEGGRLLLVFRGYGISLIDSLRLFTIGLFFNNFVPGMVGADIYQIQQMHAIRPGILKPLSLSLYLRVSGMLVNIVIGAVALALTWHHWSSYLSIQSIPIGVSGIVLLAVVAIIVFCTLIALSERARTAAGRLMRKIIDVISKTGSVTLAFGIKNHAIVAILGLSIISTRVASLLLLTAAFGESIGPLNVLVAVTITRIALLIPISFAGLGVSEITIAAIFIASGVTPSIAVSVTLVARCYSWLVSLVGGFWLLIDSGNPKILKRSNQRG